MASGDIGPLSELCDLNLSNRDLEEVDALAQEGFHDLESINLAFNSLSRVEPLPRIRSLTR